MNIEEIKYILDKFDKVLENYELDKKLGQMSTDSIYHLFPSEIITIKDYIKQKENIIKEVRESAKRELKIAEENIKNSEQWLEVEEEQEHAKKDIHTGKVVKRYMEMFLEISDKADKEDK